MTGSHREIAFSHPKRSTLCDAPDNRLYCIHPASILPVERGGRSTTARSPREVPKTVLSHTGWNHRMIASLGGKFTAGLFAVAFLALTLLFTAAPARAEGAVNVIEVKDSINPGVEEFIKHAIELSAEEKAECLVILLNTPGGLMSAMRGIVEDILNAPLPVVVYVSPSGAQAASAGVLVTAAADIAAMAPGTNIGAAHPVTSDGGNIPTTMEEKVVNDMTALAKSIADERGRNAKWLEDAIRKSVSIPAEEALRLNVIDVVSGDLASLLKALDGWRIHRGNRTTVTLHTQGRELRRIEPGLGFRILQVISNPNISYILLLVGLAGLYFELSQPGAILPGIVGGVSLILAFYSMQTLPVNYAGMLLILLAVVCFFLEIKVASYGMLSLAGVLLMTIGSLMLYRFPGEGLQIAMSVLVPAVMIVSAFFATVAALAFRAQTARARTGAEALIGSVGEVKVTLAPRGKVFVDGELWNAEADERIPAGEAVRVVSVENLKLKVRRIGVN